MTTIFSIDHIFGIINTLLIVFGCIGGYFVFKQNQRITTIKIQDETIKALNDKIDIIESKILDLERENTQQKYVINTIQAALKQRGILVTIDGDLVTISDASGSHSIARRSDQEQVQTNVTPPPHRTVRRRKEQ